MEINKAPCDREQFNHFGKSSTECISPADCRPGNGHFLAEVLEGLRKPQKELPPKYFYDDRGAQLFEDICTMDEYYIPLTEASIIDDHIVEMVELLGEDVLLVEYGCGDCAKTRILLNHLRQPAGFVPIDISFEQLQRVSVALTGEYPGLEVLPVCADYTCDFELPAPCRPPARKVVFFPGSTLGNFDPLPAQLFLKEAGRVCGPGGALLLGIDLAKDPGVLHKAYNDSNGITAEFNLNLLKRINLELDANFKLEQFQHYAFYNLAANRMEMHLVSLREQRVYVGGLVFDFAQGESIWTESSYKYTLAGFEKLATSAGFGVDRVWTDERQWFSVHYLVKDGCKRGAASRRG